MCALRRIQNTGILAERYKKAGGNISVILKPGGDHHPHSLKDPQPIVDFLVIPSLRIIPTAEQRGK